MLINKSNSDLPVFANVLVLYVAIIANLLTFFKRWAVWKVMQQKWPNFMTQTWIQSSKKYCLYIPQFAKKSAQKLPGPTN